MTGSATFDDRYGSVAVIGGMLSMSGNFTASGPYQAYYAEDGFHIFGGTVSVSDGGSGGVGFATPSAFFISAGTVNANGHLIGIHAGTVMIGGGRLNAAGEVGAGIYIDGGSLQAYGGTLYTWGLECGVHLVDADLQLGNNLRRATIHGENQSAIKTEGRCSLTLDSGLAVKEPVDKVISSDNILDPSGAPVNRVVIEPETLSATFRPGDGTGEFVVYSDLEIGSTFTVPDFFESWTAPGTTHFNGWTYKDPETEAGWYPVGAIKLGKEHTILGTTTFTADYANWITGWEDDSGLEDVLFEVECNAAILDQTAEFPVKAGENAGIMFSFDDPDLYYVDEVFVLNQSGQVIDSFTLQRVGDYYDGGFTMPEEDVSLKFTVKQLEGNPPEITKQPKSMIVSTSAIPESVEFSVVTTGSDLRYQWQAYDESGQSPVWVDLRQDNTITGVKTDTVRLNTRMINEPGEAILRCVVSNPFGTVNSNEVRLIVVRGTGWNWTRLGKIFIREDGTLPVNQWLEIDGKWYHFDDMGIMQTGWTKVNSKWYYLDGDDGAMQTGWIKLSGKWYYLSGNGAMVTGWQTIGGKKYYFESSGAMVTGWKKIDGKYYYFAGGGAMATDWQTINGKTYYLGTDGVMRTGWQKINNKWFYFAGSGAMAKGWNKLSGKWYYFDTSGVMQVGWKTISGSTYYFKSSGVMAANEWCKGYWLNANGTWTYKYKASWKQNSKGWYYQDTSGWYAKLTTLTIDDKQYSFDAKGYLVQ